MQFFVHFAGQQPVDMATQRLWEIWDREAFAALGAARPVCEYRQLAAFLREQAGSG